MATERSSSTGNHQGENRSETHTKIDGEPDRRYENNGQGQVKDPAHDGRLVENREKGISMQDSDDSNTGNSNQRQREAASHSGNRSQNRSTKSTDKR